MSGPLAGLTVVELAGLGPAPFCGMVLADLGADVVRVDRAASDNRGLSFTPRFDVLNRGKRSVAVDLKSSHGLEVVLRLAESSDVLIEGFRPGVTERLGLGPAECLARNPELVYGRMTGWGQDGPWATIAGHDIDYIALNGTLHSIGVAEAPTPPLNLVGDFGGGGMLLALGVVSAVLHARQSGQGQIVDAAMIDGSALLMSSHHGFIAEGWWKQERASNLLDGGAPFYATYRTRDGRFMAVGALEPHFFRVFVEGLGLEVDELPHQMDRDSWPEMRTTFESVFLKKTRDEWASIFDGTDSCVAPVLSPNEAPSHPQIAARGTFVDVDGVRQPGPAPRFSMTHPVVRNGPTTPGDSTDWVLDRLGYSPDEIGMLRESGAVE